MRRLRQAGPGGDPVLGLLCPRERVTLLSPTLSWPVPFLPSHGTPQAVRPSVSAPAECDNDISSPSRRERKPGSHANARRVNKLLSRLCVQISVSLAPDAPCYPPAACGGGDGEGRQPSRPQNLTPGCCLSTHAQGGLRGPQALNNGAVGQA